ncbi:ribonuclease H-like domain-containing protein, partial [Tanacetum coccineum]
MDRRPHLIHQPTNGSRYVRGTLSYGLQLYSSTTSSLVAYSDADWAGCPTTRQSTSMVIVFFLATIFSPGHRSANLFFLDLVLRLSIGVLPMRLLKLASYDLVATGAIRVLHVPSRYQYADIFTKGLPTCLFDEFRISLER